MSEFDLLDLYLDRVWAALHVRPRRAREICEELRTHLDDQVRDLQRSGLDRRAAVMKAIEKLGEPKAVARVLTEANSHHRRGNLLAGLAVGVLLGSPIWYLVTVALWLLHMVSAWGLTRYWYDSVIFGGGFGGIIGVAVSSGRLKMSRVFAVLGLVAAALFGAWSLALFHMGGFIDARWAVRFYFEGLAPLLTMVATIGFGVEWGVHRWALRNTTPPAAHAHRMDGRSARSGRPPFTRAPGGFTLVELLVVMAILGLLAGVLLAMGARSRHTAMQASCINNLHQIGLALGMYLDDYGVRPTRITDLARAGYASPDVLVCPQDATGDYSGLFCRQWTDGRCGPSPSLPTSYVYIGGARTDDMYERLERLGGQASYLVCPSHGHPAKEGWEQPPAVGYYEGKILRLSFDGSVHTGNVTWARGRTQGDTWTVYSFWKLFTDVPGEPPFDDRPPAL
jgi:prepilin-type N-terminal cleavage/methylation domain-containing protein